MRNLFLLFCLIIQFPFPRCSLAETGTNTESIRENPVISDVYIGLFLFDIYKIDDANQNVSVDFILTLSWSDSSITATQYPGLLSDSKDIWKPRIRFANSINLESDPEDYMEMGPDGKLILKQRYFGDISLNQNFEDFPFDVQEIEIKLLFILPPDINTLADEGSTGQRELLTILDWDIGKGNLERSSGDFDEANFHYWSYSLSAKRQTGYYIWKVIFPLLLVVFMSWTVFWVDPVHIGAQLTVATTSMLTLIAYHFTLVDRIPNISYLTQLDVIIILANTFIFLALIEAIVTARLASLEKIEVARRIDNFSKLIFPGILLIILVYFLVF